LTVLFCGTANADEIGSVKEKTYSVSGKTGYELYTSIGARGPQGAIAQTSYSLKWKRLFDEEGGDCRLVSAKPELVIIYTFPKPSGKLPDQLEKLWKTFIAGVREHEKVHGKMIREMVSQTQERIAGAKVANDRTCAKVKREVSRMIDEARQDYKQRSADFDRVELSDGGNVHSLILALVNGDLPPMPY
jgi:predicted secreted Zn-dependent protease